MQYRRQPVQRLLATALLLVVGWGLALLSAEARRVRVATFNVEMGIGEPGSEKYEAQKMVLRRIDADIVAFQELRRASSNHWARLGEELNYPHRVWGKTGPLSGQMDLGFWSRFPVIDSADVESPEGAREFARFPLRIRVQVPGAARPLTLWNLHHKAMFEPRDEFRRAVEAFRVAGDIARHLKAHPDEMELVVLGDMNDDPARNVQTEFFTEPPPGLPSRYQLGPDIPFPLPYRPFPIAVYARAGPGFRPVPAFRQNSDHGSTHFYTNLRLDWIFASEPFWRHPDGPPVGEIYHSEWDQPEGGGLPKAGPRPPPDLSLKASDHYPVFADLHMEDAGENAADDSR